MSCGQLRAARRECGNINARKSEIHISLLRDIFATEYTELD